MDITTYFIAEHVYLVAANEFAWVYTPEGEYVGAGDGFMDYLDYMGEGDPV